MKILERKKPTVIISCPHCGSKLELEKEDIWWHRDIDGGNSPCVTCVACGKGFDVEGYKSVNKLL